MRQARPWVGWLAAILACASTGSCGERGGDPPRVGEAPPADSPVVRVGLDGISFAGRQVVTLEGDLTRGADAKFKRSGPKDLELVPLRSAIEDARQKGRIDREIVVFVHRKTPFRVLEEVVFSGERAGVGTFELREEAYDGRKVRVKQPPPVGGPRTDADGKVTGPRPLSLSVLVADGGVVLKTSSGNIAPGCMNAGPGLTFPKRGTAHDVRGLETCLKRLKVARPEFENETSVIVLASADTPFSLLMDVLEYLPGTAQTPLFPDVSFGIVP